MRAFVLAGGQGTRLRERLGDLPKPLAPVAGKPLLARQIEWLGGHGVREVVLCVGHGAERIQEALGDGRALGVPLVYSRETEPLGTGGALKLAEPFVEGASLVLNGDTLLEIDPLALERAREERGAIGAVALFRVEDTSAAGSVELDDSCAVTRFVEKDERRREAGWANGGCYSFDPSLWTWLPAGACSLERDVLPLLAKQRALLGRRFEGSFFDIGTPEGWERAERRFAA